jgi:hypothetical protein
MTHTEEIWRRGREDLVIADERGEEEVFLWEHASRVARTAQLITSIPEAKQRDPDETALLAAALYHEAGWITQLEDKLITREELLASTGPTKDTNHQLGALRMRQSLGDLLPPQTLERAAETIRSLHDRRSPLVEAQILSDAENFEEFGVLCLWTQIRRQARLGKGVEGILSLWQRQKQYRYWEARLQSFRFPAVRSAAERRLEQYERVLQELDDQVSAKDLMTILIDGDRGPSIVRSSP